MRKKISVSVALAITLIAMTVTFSITMILSMNIFDSTVSDVTEKQAFYNKISEIDTYVRSNFYGEIDDGYLYDRVAMGFLNGLDDSYSTYYTAEEYATLQDIQSGRLVGIGLVATKESGSGNFRIIKVFAGSPADEAGLTTGMWITGVDEVGSRSINTQAGLNQLLRGEQGTTVTVYCLEGTEEVPYEIQRVNYASPTVESQIVDGYAYIRIYSFAESTASDFDYFVNEAIRQDVKGLVFDLRGNSTGQIDYSYDMIDLLCPLGTIATAEYRNGTTRALRWSDEENQVDLPMVCLVDSTTAGAAELFASCVRDLSGGQIVGEPTAGKGRIQRTQQLSDGSTISLTYAKIYTGEAGYSFDEVGLTPDLEVAADYEDEGILYTPNFTTDNMLRRSMELVRSMARALGLETDQAATASSGEDTSSAVDSSLPEGGDASLPEGGGDVAGEGDGAEQPPDDERD